MKKEKEANKKDFLYSNLPRTRVALFKDIIKNQFMNIIIIGLILLVSFLPLVIYRYYNLIVTSDIIIANQVDMKDKLSSTTLIYESINILLLLFAGISISGVMRIVKRMCYSLGYFIGADFIEGIKENFKDVLTLIFIFGVINFLIENIAISYMTTNTLVYYLLKIVKYIFIIPMLITSIVLSSIYSDGIFKKIKTSFIVYMKNLPSITLIMVIMASPLLILLINSTFIELFYPMMYLLIYLPFALIAIVLFYNYIFDKNINIYHFKELVNKGLYKD